MTPLRAIESHRRWIFASNRHIDVLKGQGDLGLSARRANLDHLVGQKKDGRARRQKHHRVASRDRQRCEGSGGRHDGCVAGLVLLMVGAQSEVDCLSIYK